MAELKKHLTLTHLIFLAAGAIIGSGIMVIPAIAADIAGPGSLWVWICVGVFALCFSLIFAELASMFPSSGGIYTYVRKAFGDFWGFVTGWIAFVIGWVTIAMLTSAGLDYLGAIIPIISTTLVKSICGVAIIGGLTLLNLRTIKGSGHFQTIFTSVTILALVGLIIFGVTKVEAVNYAPMKVTLIPFLLAAAYIFEPFIGWESMGFLSEETKNKRNISVAIIAGTAIVVAIYIGIVAILLGVLGGKLTGTPLLQLSNALFGGLGATIFGIIAVGIILGAVNSWVISHARVPYSMARDRLLPGTFTKTNRYGAPKNGLIVQFVCASLVFLFLGGMFKAILETLIPLALVIYFLVVIAYIKLRRQKQPEFNTRVGKFMPLIILPAILLILINIRYEWRYFLIAAAAISLCIPFYIQIKLQQDKNFIRKFYKHRLLNAIHRKKIKLKLLKHFKINKDDYILDYGCGTGILTERLAKKVPQGRVVAMDLVHEKLARLRDEQRKNLKKFGNVIIVEEDKAVKFEKNLFDKIIGGGVLNYVNNPESLLKNMHGALRKDGEVAFALVDSWGHPAPLKLNDPEKIEKVFKSAGFSSVKIKRYGGATTKYFIYAKK